MGFAQKATELLALLAGLELSFTKNLFSIIVESDSHVLCNLFKDEQYRYSHLLNDCSFLLDVVGLEATTHISREVNSVMTAAEGRARLLVRIRYMSVFFFDDVNEHSVISLHHSAKAPSPRPTNSFWKTDDIFFRKPAF